MFHDNEKVTVERRVVRGSFQSKLLTILPERFDQNTIKMKRVGKVVVLDSIPGETSKSGEPLDFFAKLAPALETTNMNDLPMLDLPVAMQNRLMDHQKIGVRWLHSLYLNNSGGILGDDMGLGKTYQVICLLAGLMQQQLIKRVLILAPVSVLPNWQREILEHLKPHFPGLQVHLTNSDLTKKKRIQILDSTFSSSSRGFSPQIVISSYQLVSNMIDDFSNRGRWDYVILDEGHVIKNPTTKTSKSMHLLRSSHRLILTGTPIQNNLNEFWAIVNWATKGERVGTLSAFKEDFTLPIELGQNPKASYEERRIADETAQNLLALIKPILLQRKKCELPSNDQLCLPTKVELVVWVPLATSQRELYEQFIHSRQFSIAVNRTTCPVEVINHLKTVCRHPLLIEALEMNRKRRDQATAAASGVTVPSPRPPARTKSSQRRPRDEIEDEGMDFLNHGMADMSMREDGAGEEEGELEEVLRSLPTNASVYDVVQREPDVKELLRGSIKLRILLKLVHRLHYAGHRTLVFSQSRLMLDIIQRVFVEYGLATHRIDGSVRSSERQRIIDEYNDLSEDNIGPSICLLTTKACGFGITLTGADRVIIYDPSWNPAEDRQAVDRAYRIGQIKPVVVYRLIMASSVEEKMYEKQVFKDGIRVVTESGTSSRYFSKDETTELFTLGPVDQSVVMEKLWAAAGGSCLREFPDTRGELPSALGFTRHDTLYTEARPNGASQGEDAYAQYVDSAHIPSDGEDDEVGIPPTPAAKQRTKGPSTVTKKHHQTPGKENILDALNKIREKAKLTSADKKTPEQDNFFDLISPPPRNRYSSAYVLSDSPPDSHFGEAPMSQLTVSTCGGSPMRTQEESDLDYAHLSASKLYQGEPSPVAEAPPVRAQTPLCSDSEDEVDEVDNVDDDAAESGRENSDVSVDENEQEEDEGVGLKWTHADITAFNVLKAEKLFTPPVSPNVPNTQVEVGASPQLAHDESHNYHEFDEETSDGFDVGDEPDCEDHNEGMGGNDNEELPIAELDCDDPIGRLLQSVLTSAATEEDDEPIEEVLGIIDFMALETASDSEDSEDAKQKNGEVEGVLSVDHTDDYSSELDCDDDPIGRLLQSVLPVAVILEAELPQKKETSDVSVDGSESAEFEEQTVAQSVAGVLNLPCVDEEKQLEVGLDPIFEAPQEAEICIPSASECFEYEVNQDCGGDDNDLATYDASVEPADQVFEDAADGDSLNTASLSGRESFDQGDIADPSIDDRHRSPIPHTPPARMQTPLCSDSEDEDPQEGTETPLCDEIKEEGGCDDGVVEEDEENEDEDDDEEFAMTVDVGPGGGDSSKARGASGYLFNLCEMGSMKRTNSTRIDETEADSEDHSGESLPENELTTEIKDNETAATDFRSAGMTSPETSASQEGGARIATAGVTTRKPKRSPFFSNYMEPDLFASPPWMPSNGSIFSPAVMPQATRSIEDVSSSSVFASGGTVVDDENSITTNEARASLSPATPLQHTTHDPLQDLVDLVRDLKIAPAAATPISKISFQTTAGQFSNMIIKVQSVSRVNRSFAQLSDSDDSDSESDGSEESFPDSRCSPFVTVPDTMEGNAAQTPILLPEKDGTPVAPPTSETLFSGTESESQSQLQTPVLESPSMKSADAPFPRAALFHSPQRRSSAWRLSTGTISSLSEDSFAAGEEDQEEEESAPSVPKVEDLLPLEIRSTALHAVCEATDDDDGDEETVVSALSSLQGLSFDLFGEMLVPSLTMDPHSVIDSNRDVLFKLNLKKVNYSIYRPHCTLSFDQIDTYNDFLLKGRESELIEKCKSAAGSYQQALALCDECAALHGKLAWLLQKLDRN